jgi:glycosyltransferase involved in cell wall biosynthesis
LRVLVVCGRWDLVGGSERYAGEVVRELIARGHQVRVACTGGEQDGADEVRICSGLSSSKPSRAERSELAAACAGRDVTLVLAWINLAALAELLQGPPLVRFVQDHTLFCPGLNKLLGDGSPCESPLGMVCIERYWLKGGCSGQKIDGLPALLRPLRSLRRALAEIELVGRCKRVLVASDYMRAELVRSGLDPNNITVLPYFTRSATPALAAESLDPASAKIWQVPGTFKLFVPARLVLPDKGIDYLLTALGQTETNVNLVIAGSGPAEAWLQQKAQDEGLASRVHFTGWCKPAQVEALYAACDGVAFPSVWNEPFGLVGIEAMAHGKPVVAFDVGGVRQWLVPEETGLLVPRRETLALAKAIDRLAQDSLLCARLGDAGQSRAREEFSSDKHMSALEQVLS